MRHTARLAATLLMSIGVAYAEASAQQNAPSPLGEKIRAQEIVMHQASGHTDGVAWLKLATLYQDAARYSSAESAYRKAISLLKTKDRGAFATTLDHMGSLYVERGKFAKAEPLERMALKIREDANDTAGIGATYTHLATLSYGRHDLAAAEADAEMAVSILVPEHLGHAAQTRATPEEQMSALINLSLIRCARGACAEAIQDLDRALSLAHAHYAIDSFPVGFVDFLLGYVHWKSGDNRATTELMRATALPRWTFSLAGGIPPTPLLSGNTKLSLYSAEKPRRQTNWVSELQASKSRRPWPLPNPTAP
ncbi:MAG TPA: tetratricopeptide repeat protein [Terracidiphilus sp.]|jgi:tetratricopeptide (TPR) repeat protein